MHFLRFLAHYSHPPPVFVLKIHNGADSELMRRDFLLAQDGVLAFLARAGVNVPTPQRVGASGTSIADCTLPLRTGEPCTHAVRLLAYVKGLLLSDCQQTLPLMHSLGAAVGHLSSTLAVLFSSFFFFLFSLLSTAILTPVMVLAASLLPNYAGITLTNRLRYLKGL